jgi:hypothetical protein
MSRMESGTKLDVLPKLEKFLQMEFGVLSN